MKTSNSALQQALEAWVVLVAVAAALPDPSAPRTNAILEFCRTFVPPSTTEDDVMHFSNSLAADEEFFLSTSRELAQCASGDSVEKIEGNQRTKATFTLLPLPGTEAEASSLDIVRELSFVSADRGATWTAEG
ncbi:hypothetical protein B484DRAFT_395641 [Ochromonadaceae sp. CCMP2298]|nr:hypothetical protein B484DRAFT_395641 [Ochromonadaceae sp. CCMP2298]|mmetsp:Transcript_24110/g.53646  ORF Transcript_24110/g.53646 Transcript_24110/m.53646 type:complete len:133 (+) Transcript_24110:223-621(+)